MTGEAAPVRLTIEEMTERAQQLARAVRELYLLDEEQAEVKKAMAAERKNAERHVRDLAHVVSTGIEDRPAQMLLLDRTGG